MRWLMAILYSTMNTTSLSKMLSNSYIIPRSTILIFDSGVGGLSIYQAVKQLLPNLHYIYLIDNLAFPYGEKSEDFILTRVLDIISTIQQRHPEVIVIIACNTASTVSLSVLRQYFSFPIIGVVPAIKPAVQMTTNGVIGLLATRCTIQSNYTQKLISHFAINCKMELLGSAKLVELVEAKLYGKIVSLTMLKKILNPWLNMKEPPDTVVLGCTHFPLLKNELTLVLPKGTKLVDSGTAIANRTAWVVSTQKNLLLTQEDNRAYCMVRDKNTNALSHILKKIWFSNIGSIITIIGFSLIYNN
ncbi:glutamate racemase [Serratia symbiotica str. 'Cinara cedri']|nr:glutamate racemase [Serratia symbiotica str. 'Cinara cedri']